jgi:predicted aspartyl protease
MKSRFICGIMLFILGSLALFSQSNVRECASKPESQRDYRVASGHSALRIPFEEDDGHIFLQVRINNSAPLWFALDTGAIRSVVDRRRAQTLGLRSAGSQQVGGAGGTEDAAIIKGVSIKLPGVELCNQTVWSLPLEALSVANGREMAGIIGYELFSHFVVEIDYAALYINLYEPHSYQYRGRGESIPLELQNGEIYVPAKVTVTGHDAFEGQFVIDTGGNGTLLLAKSFVEEHKLLEVVKPTIQAHGGGVGGEVQLVIGRVKSLRIGSFVIDKPVTGFIKIGEIAEPGKIGNIGGRLLRKFRVIFDYSRQRMILEPTSRLTEAEEFDMSGAAVIAEGSAFNVIKVDRVRPDSPAAQVDLRPQDAIIAVDGQPATTLTVNKLRKMFRVEGREYLLSVKRGEQMLEIKIKLRRLI